MNLWSIVDVALPPTLIAEGCALATWGIHLLAAGGPYAEMFVAAGVVFIGVCNFLGGVFVVISRRQRR